MSPRSTLFTVLLSASIALAQVPPVNGPVCYGNCEQSDDSPRRTTSGTTSEPTPESPAQREAREAAEAEARRRQEAADRAAEQAADDARSELESLERQGAAQRAKLDSFERFERHALQREQFAPEVRKALAPVPKVIPGPPAPPALSLKDYVRRLNDAERARQVGLHATAPPPLATTTPASGPTGFTAPPALGPEPLGVLAALARTRAEARGIADEFAKEQFWLAPDRYVPGLKTLRSALEDGKQYFTALRDLNQRTIEGTFGQAREVVWSLGSGTTTATVTDAENTALLQRQGGDVTRTTSALLSDKVRGTLFGDVIEKANGWAGGGQAP